MTRRQPLIVCAVCVSLFGLPAASRALEVPAGTTVEIRLQQNLSTETTRPKDPVKAVVIAPVMAAGQFAIPPGAIILGAVEKATKSTQPDERSLLLINFTQIEINGAKLKLAARLTAVDNAREKVDEQGQINGVLASETITGQLDTELDKLSGKYSGLAGVLSSVKNAVLEKPQADITYNAGVEMELKLTAPLELKQPGGPGPAGSVQPIPDQDSLISLVAHEPFQTMAESPRKPSDITNLILIGSEDAVRKAFQDAGWSSAASLNAFSKFETVRAVAENRGYKEAPVSILLLDGKPPDIVFEKLNNTFAHRHHLRVWRRSVTFLGQPVWAITATHDTGISFSQQDLTFIHRIDPQIDRERAKVVNDLLFTGDVRGISLVDRPNVPQHGENATGDNLDTDGRIAVLLLK